MSIKKYIDVTDMLNHSSGSHKIESMIDVHANQEAMTTQNTVEDDNQLLEYYHSSSNCGGNNNINYNIELDYKDKGFLICQSEYMNSL